MRHIACTNEACALRGLCFFDFEPPEAIVLCGECQQAMRVTEPVEVTEEADAPAVEILVDEAELERIFPHLTRAPVPSVETALAGALEALPDGPVSKKDLADVIATLRGNDA
jgi:hypothetical protein